MPALVDGRPLLTRLEQFLLRLAGRPVLGGEKQGGVPPQDFLTAVPEEPFGSRIPTDYASLRVDHEDAVVLGVLDDEAEGRLGLLARNKRSVFFHGIGIHL